MPLKYRTFAHLSILLLIVARQANLFNQIILSILLRFPLVLFFLTPCVLLFILVPARMQHFANFTDQSLLTNHKNEGELYHVDCRPLE